MAEQIVTAPQRTSSPLVAGRAPLYSLEAEEYLLGCCLLDGSESIARCLEARLSGVAFYSPANRLIFEKICEIYQKSPPVTVEVLAEELKTARQLDTVGGYVYLARLGAGIPTTAQAQFFISKVRELSLVRELMKVVTGTAESCLKYSGGLEEFMDQVEQEIFRVTQDRVADAAKTMRDTTREAMTVINKMMMEKGEYTGVATGFKPLDELTWGFQRQEMIVLAARPSVGKTAFALNCVEAAGIPRRGDPITTLIFSLEMSAAQLALRMLCSRSRTNMMHLRGGLSKNGGEYNKLVTTADEISKAPIFIDDSSHLSVMELRAKARRLHARRKLGLIVVDYLQLLSPTDSQIPREQQVAEASRGLKALAKELDLPVLVLSQLNRSSEKENRAPKLADLRESGCVTGDTLILDARSGRRIPIKEIAERLHQAPFYTLGLNPDYSASEHVVSRAFYSGRKPVSEMRTRSGRRIAATANHPFRTINGWTSLENLAVGDRIAVARNVDVAEPTNPLSTDEAILLAHLLGDGCILPRQPYHYTSEDVCNLAEVERTASSLFGIQTRRVAQKNWHHVYLPSTEPLARGRAHPITAWFGRLGIERVRAPLKRIPEDLFRCDSNLIALFLRHLWATDGNISWKPVAGHNPRVAIYYATTSRQLGDQVQHLLLRLGVLSKIQKIDQKAYRPIYHVVVQGSREQRTFLNKVGSFGERGAVIPLIISALEQIEGNPKIDSIPREAWKRFVEPAREAAGLTTREFQLQLGTKYCGTSIFKKDISRDRMTRISKIAPSSELTALSRSSILWDEILSISPQGMADVYDVTVPEVHNFLANDIYVHNSIEQDADVVLMLARPKDADERSLTPVDTVELTVAKQRNGPTTGEPLKLTFQKEFTRFETQAQ